MINAICFMYIHKIIEIKKDHSFYKSNHAGPRQHLDQSDMPMIPTVLQYSLMTMIFEPPLTNSSTRYR